MPAASSPTYSISGFIREKLAVAREACETWSRQRRRRPGMARVYTPWQVYWGEAYGLQLKEWLLKPVFEALESAGTVGDLIVDVGSGARPVTRFIEAHPGRKRILVDVAAENECSAGEQKIRLDVEKVSDPGSLSFRKALLRVCRFLEIAPGKEGKSADTMVFADILNYVDFRKVLGGFANFLKPGGRLIVVNLPMRGNQSLFSEKGLKNNVHLCEWLEQERFEIEHKAFPCRPKNETDEAEEFIVLVARKRGGL